MPVRSRVHVGLVFAVLLIIWSAGGTLLHRYMLTQTNASHLAETASQLARRIEKHIDFVVIASTDFLIAGHGSCTQAARAALQQLMLDTASVTDIHLIAPSGACSVFGDLSATLPAEEVRQTWTPGRNPEFRFGATGAQTDGRFGISWTFANASELIFIVNADATLFDVLPSELRDFGRVDLTIGEQMLARFDGDSFDAALERDARGFRADGARYPIRTDIAVAQTALLAWRSAVPLGLIAGWTLLGLMGAGLASYAVFRRHDTELESVIRALTNGEIVPHFQPIVDCHTGEVIGCEALARWVKPGGEVIAPGRFIPLVERHDMNSDLLATMVEQTAAGLGDVLASNETIYVSFNITPKQIEADEFADTMIALARRHMLLPSQIYLELTERQPIANTEKAARTTEKLVAAGFRVSIDDAGTGHNGMAAIQSLEIGTIKIDKFFVDHIDDDHRSKVMVDMFVAVAARYGMTTIAEGVETAAQLRTLRTAGVDFVQGFLFSKPVAAEIFIELLGSEWAEFSSMVRGRVGRPNAGSDRATGTAPSPASPTLEAWAIDSEDSSRQTAGQAENARLAALYRYNILDTAEDEAFNRVTRIICNALEAPMAAIAFIDADRRWFKAVSGGKRGNLPRHQSFCNRTICSSEPTIVPDTQADDRFANNILVVNAPHIRAYLGVPLETEDGHRIGSLCCVDHKPRPFSDTQIQLVKDLSNVVMDQLELRTLATYDSLTGALSRSGFRAHTERQLHQAHADGMAFSVLMIDIDHFKRINDTYGHKVGDDVLGGVLGRVTSVLGSRYTIGRLGGEEFAVGLDGKDLTRAQDLGEQIRAAFVDTAFKTCRGPLLVTVSIGVSTTTSSADDLDTLLSRADMAMYQAKAQGRNRVNAAAA